MMCSAKTNPLNCFWFQKYFKNPSVPVAFQSYLNSFKSPLKVKEEKQCYSKGTKHYFFLITRFEIQLQKNSQKTRKIQVQSLSCVNFLLFCHLGFFLMCSSSRELFQRRSQNPPFFLHYCFVLQPSFSSLRICRAVIFLPKPIILFRKPQKLQLAAHHFINILTVCSRDHFCVQTVSVQFQLLQFL